MYTFTKVGHIQGVPKKMFISKKGEQLTNEYFFGTPGT